MPKLIPDVAGFYDIVRLSYGLEPAEVGKLVEFLRLVSEDGHATKTP